MDFSPLRNSASLLHLAQLSFATGATMPKLEGIREFLQVVDNGSFSKAAEKLSLSNAQVSRLISQLEDHLGIRLLHRSTRSLTLTEEGKVYYENCKKSFALLEDTELALTQRVLVPTGTLKISLSGWFQEQFVVPMLVEFINIYNKLEVEVVFSDLQVDLIEQGFDLAIVGGVLNDSNYVARQLSSCRLCLCAGPDYLYERGTPHTLKDLTQHNCLTGSSQSWPLSNNNAFFNQPVKGNWKSDNAHAILAATLQNTGIAHLPVPFIDSYLKSGALIEVLPEYTKKGTPVSIVYPSRNNLSARVRFFIDYFAEKLNPSALAPQEKQYLLGA